MLGPLLTVATIAAAAGLVLLAPRLLPRWSALRGMPGAGLLMWQSVSVSGALCALLAAPAAVLTTGFDQPLLLGLAITVSLLVLGRLLWSGHRVGTDLRRRRARHRELVDLVGSRLDRDVPATGRSTREPAVAVMAPGNPAAYCLPGAGDRIVLTQATVDRLTPEQLRAVLAHEHGHLAQRHDLLLELFTVLHEAVPRPVRVRAALDEVHLLAEALADRVAERAVGHTDLARALAAMATSGSPEVTARIRLLARPAAPRHTRLGVVALAGAVLALPLLLATGVALVRWG